MDSVNEALSQLKRLSPNEALKALDLIEARRRDDKFIRYWKPWEPDQLYAVKEFTEGTKVFGILGGNRSGKTEAGAFIVCAFLLGKEYFRGEPAWEYVKDLPIPEGRKRNIWIVGLDFGLVRDVIWREKLRAGRTHPGFLPHDPLVIEKINEGDFQIFARDGSVVTCKSADSGREKFQGASVDLVWIDEECDKSVFDECYQRTSDCAGKLLLTLTPIKAIDTGVSEPWVADLYEEFKQGRKDLKFCHLSFLNNPFVPDSEKELAKLKWAGSPEERARLYGEFFRRSGLVYPMWDPKKHIVRPFPIPKEWKRIVSIDPASTGMTAALWAAVSPAGDLYFFREYYQRDRTVGEHAQAIILRNCGETVDFWLIDPKWGSQRGAADHKQNYLLYREAGLPVRLAEVGQDYGMNASREYMNSSVTEGARHPGCYFFEGQLANFEWEINRYTYARFERGEMKGLSKDKPIKRNDHLMNAFQYLCAQNPRPRRERVTHDRFIVHNELSEQFYGGAISIARNNNSYT